MQQTLFPTDSPELPISKKPLFESGDLNEPQHEAVTHDKGPVLVIAGAGSGKTRTLVYRVAYLIEQGTSPENILLLTFTRRAAQEMLMRASRLLDNSCQDVLGGTFHAVANLLLRRYGHYLGYSSNFTIIDRADAEGIVNLLKSSLSLSGAGKKFPSKRVIINAFSQAVNKSLPLEQVFEENHGHLTEYLPDILAIQDHYKKFKLEHGLMDYDDLLVNWKTLLAEFPDVRSEVAARFHYIMVDEYQDTNLIQAEIVRLLAHGHDNVMVVGDDSQSIYSFRGADFRNIMDFPGYFKNTRVIRLEENYRSCQTILSLANAVIEKCEEKYTKKLFTSIEGGEKPTLYSATDEADQARFIVGKIAELQDEGVPLSDMAVLFRSGFHSYKLELELANRQFDFEKRGGMKLTESAHIKDILSYLRILVNPQDNLSWNRILLLLDKIGPKTAQNILRQVKTADTPLEGLKLAARGKRFQPQIEQLADVLYAMSVGEDPARQFDVLMEYYQEVFERIYHDDYPKRSRDLEQLRSIIAEYDNLQRFVDDTALDPPESEAVRGLRDQFDDSRLVLSTIHSAKGLEWDTVFIIHMAEGKFPSGQAVFQDQLEEERRLFYVAVTRAKKRLFFTYPKRVMSADRSTSFGIMSPFLAELPPDLVGSTRSDFLPKNNYFSGGGKMENSHEGITSRGGTRSSGRLTSSSLKQGMAVNHPFFGKGNIETIVSDRTVNVFFPRHGTKTLHLDYARLEIVSE